MGSIVGKAMDENMKKQQDFMMKNQVVMMERQIQMQNQMRERQMAMMIAKARDMFVWYGSFYALVTPVCLVGFMKTKKPALIAPLVPLSFLFGYQYDLSYGSKVQRMREEADRIMDEEQDLLLMPHALPTMASINEALVKQKEENRINQSHDLFL